MDWFFEFWATVNQPQASLVVGILTVLAAVLGVLLGSFLFGGRVRDIKSAVDQVENVLEKHVEVVTETLEKVRHDLESLQVELSKARGDIIELDAQQAAPEEVAVEEAAPVLAEPEEPALSSLRKAWEKIQKELDRRAANVTIDGRTRAKYRRIDRRSYQSLIDLMVWDETLSDDDAALFTVAWQLWTQHRNGRKVVDNASLAKMEAVKATLVGSG